MKKGLILLTLMTVIGGTMLGAAGPARPPKPPRPASTFAHSESAAAPAEMVTFTIKPGLGAKRDTLTVVIDKGATWEEFFTKVCEQVKLPIENVGLSIVPVHGTDSLKNRLTEHEPEYLRPPNFYYSLTEPPIHRPVHGSPTNFWDDMKNNPDKYELGYMIITPKKMQQIALPQDIIAEQLTSIAEVLPAITTDPDAIADITKRLKEIADEVKSKLEAKKR